MQPTSESQLDSLSSGTIPPIERVRDGIFVVGVPTHTGVIPTYTLAYIVLDDTGRGHLIDPGVDSAANRATLVSALGSLSLGIGNLSSVIVTHLHSDHLGMAGWIAAVSGASVVMHRREQAAFEANRDAGEPAKQLRAHLDEWRVPEEFRSDFDPIATTPAATPGVGADHLVDDGDFLEIPGRRIEVVHTPGHTTGHICLVERSDSVMWAGDHILPMMFPGLGLGGTSDTNPLADYLRSLKHVAQFGDFEVLPGHGYRFLGLAERSEQTGQHHRNRTDEVESALNAAPNATIWQIAENLSWTAGWANLHGFYRLSALSQTAMHVDFLRTRKSADAS